MVTRESILRALTNFAVPVSSLAVHDAMLKIARGQTYRAEDDLFDLLDRLRDMNAVLIVDSRDCLIGIITSYDSNEYFRRRAEDLMLVDDIETMVRDLALAPFIGEDGTLDRTAMAAAIAEIAESRRRLLGRYRAAVQHYLKRLPDAPVVNPAWLEDSLVYLEPKEKPKDFEELTLWEYTELLLAKKRSEFYRTTFSSMAPEALRSMLASIREIRNVLAHFKGEISPGQRAQLQFCAQWFANHQIQLAVAWPPVEVDMEPAGTNSARVTGDQDATGALQVRESTLPPGWQPLGDGRGYIRLAQYFQSLRAGQDSVNLSFPEIEQIINAPLPPAAREHRAWWASQESAIGQQRDWVGAGWHVAQVDLTNGRVTFARARQ